MKTTARILLIAALLGLGACSREVANSNLSQVKPDMNFKEVESILGPPTRMETSPAPPQEVVKSVQITHYIYEQHGKTVTLTFVGDRLATGGVDGDFDK
jgi:hypothetical protein